jgi:hypothetical protein
MVTRLFTIGLGLFVLIAVWGAVIVPLGTGEVASLADLAGRVVDSLSRPYTSGRIATTVGGYCLGLFLIWMSAFPFIRKTMSTADRVWTVRARLWRSLGLQALSSLGEMRNTAIQILETRTTESHYCKLGSGETEVESDNTGLTSALFSSHADKINIGSCLLLKHVTVPSSKVVDVDIRNDHIQSFAAIVELNSQLWIQHRQDEELLQSPYRPKLVVQFTEKEGSYDIQLASREDNRF